MMETWRSRLVGLHFLCMHILRQPLYLARRCRVANSCRIERGCVLVHSSVGPYSYLGAGVFMNSTTVGNYCSIASGTKIGGMEHSWWWGSTSARISRHNIHGRPTVVEDDVWMGSNVIVRQGVRIGRGAVIGGGAVVLEDVMPFAMVAGVPARLIRMRFPADIERRVLETRYWNQPPDRARQLLEGIEFPPSPTMPSGAAGASTFPESTS